MRSSANVECMRGSSGHKQPLDEIIGLMRSAEERLDAIAVTTGIAGTALGLIPPMFWAAAQLGAMALCAVGWLRYISPKRPTSSLDKNVRWATILGVSAIIESVLGLVLMLN